jgi:RHS repeat-associated protein
MTASSGYTMAYRYDACGETLDTYTATSGAVDSPWRYQGRVRETASGAPDLYDFSARSYDPGLGAFTSFDSVAGSAQNPLTLNRYLYAAANPATMVDPDGHTTAADCGQNPGCLAALYGTNSTSTSSSGSSSRAAAQKARFDGEAQAHLEWANYQEAHLGACDSQSCVDWYLNQKTSDNAGPVISNSDMAWYGRMLGKAQDAADAAYQHAAKTAYGNANQSYVGGQWVGGSESYDLKNYQATHPLDGLGMLLIGGVGLGMLCVFGGEEICAAAAVGAVFGGGVGAAGYAGRCLEPWQGSCDLGGAAQAAASGAEFGGYMGGFGYAVGDFGDGASFPRLQSGSAGGPTAYMRFSSNVRLQALAQNMEDAQAAGLGDVNYCVYCRMITDDPEVDHIVPRTQGGDAAIDNAQVTCGHCNASKGAQMIPLTPPAGYVGPWPPEWANNG